MEKLGGKIEWMYGLLTVSVDAFPWVILAVQTTKFNLTHKAREREQERERKPFT